MDEKNVTEREFERYIKAQNGSLARIEKSVDEVKRMLSDSQRQMLDLINSEVDARLDCVKAGGERFATIEDAVEDCSRRMILANWLWRGFAGLLGVILTVMSILVIVRVL
jgi:hypothetical protein